VKKTNKKPRVIIFLGRSGSGKGTQAKLLVKDFGFEYIGTGDLLRQRMKKNDFTARKLRRIVNKGILAPTFLVFNNWVFELEKIKNKKNFKGVLIDGSPRKVFEAELMDCAFDWFELKDIKVFLLDISEQEAFDRLTKRRICKTCGRLIPWLGTFKNLKVCDKCGGDLETRVDDKPEAIRSRLNFYKKDIEPVVDYYRKQGKLIKIDGEKSIGDVYQDIKSKIKSQKSKTQIKSKINI
jgi:adenylate kinase